MDDSTSSPQVKYIDLHTHTVHSDGALRPEELVKKASELGLAAIAISDHENTDGLEEAIESGEKYGVEVVPAVEISSYPDPLTEHHILGYYIDYKDAGLQKIFKKLQDGREKRAKKVIDNLNKLGYQINFGDVKAAASGTIVQPHIAWSVITDLENRAKLKKDFGTVPDTGEFIRKYLIPGAPAYEARETLKPKEAVELIHKVGGVAAFAHPCWTTVTKENNKLVFDDKKFEQLVKAGVDGVEVLAHRGSEEDTRECVEHFTALAEKYKLVVTGGSDYHGFGSAGKSLGFTDFYLKVPYRVLEELKLRHRNSYKI
mgnify:CR=1 FL=1